MGNLVNKKHKKQELYIADQEQKQDPPPKKKKIGCVFVQRFLGEGEVLQCKFT